MTKKIATIRLGSQHWRICPWARCKDCEPLSWLNDEFWATEWLSRLKPDPLSMSALRDLAGRGLSVGFGVLGDDAVIRKVARQLASFRLHLCQLPEMDYRTRGGSGAPRPPERQEPERPAAAETQAVQRPQQQPAATLDTAIKATWVEIELVDAASHPVTGARYELKLPDGSVKQGYLDAQGRARYEKITAGQCAVRFPEYDGAEWDAA